MKRIQGSILIGCISILSSCLPPAVLERPALPSLEYTRKMHANRPLGPFTSRAEEQQAAIAEMPGQPEQGRAQLHYVKDWPDSAEQTSQDYAMNMPQYEQQQPPAYREYRAPQPTTRPYRGQLQLGNPGLTSSLWRETSTGNNLFRDHRAFQPMDLVTIVVAEQSQGSKVAETELTKESSFLAGIANLFNIETDIQGKNPGLDTGALVSADMQTEFTGEGDTSRSGSLTARISAMVVEVLPSGVMRIEGEKIISVNNEEQIMMISGLVRQRDLNSDNEVQSDKIANLRIDYFGRGVVSEQQYAGWLGRLFTAFWPF